MDAVVEKIRNSRKYRWISPETIRDVVRQEFARGGRTKQSIAVVRARLHRVAAFYLGEPDYDRAEEDLRSAFQSGDRAAVADVCRRIMQSHVSARERLGELSQIYRTLWDACGRPQRLADLACSYNPLAFGWMGLSRTVEYHAFDINQRTVRLLHVYFEGEGLRPLPAVRDTLCRPPEVEVDVALLLKMYHCLEHRRRGAGWEVVEAVRARHLAVSFPTRSLAGRQVDIIGNYEPLIRRRAEDQGWPCRRIDFQSETFLLIAKEPSRPAPP